MERLAPVQFRRWDQALALDASVLRRWLQHTSIPALRRALAVRLLPLDPAAALPVLSELSEEERRSAAVELAERGQVAESFALAGRGDAHLLEEPCCHHVPERRIAKRSVGVARRPRFGGRWSAFGRHNGSPSRTELAPVQAD
ncbi:MAG: hypothetical protein HY319_20125 [Armatimonadetes bacterium]|nr:hypothetical protein [Armatimonadota bacterium]